MVIQLPDGTVQFTFICPHAERVAIAGDFNGWQPTFAMTRLDESSWRSRLRLGPGVYQFRYCVDGQWYNDYAAFGLEHGPHGLNSVVKVESARRRPPCAVDRTERSSASVPAVRDRIASPPSAGNTNRQKVRARSETLETLERMHHAAMALACTA